MHPSTQFSLAAFQSDLSPEAVDEALRAAVNAHRHAERSVVLWFAEVKRRRLYMPLGFGSMFLYATESLEFSQTKTCQLLRIADALAAHPTLRVALASGDLPWTKAREIVSVVTHDTVEEWIALAKRVSRRKLAQAVADARQSSRAARASDPAQARLGSVASASAAFGTRSSPLGESQAVAPSSKEPELRERAGTAQAPLLTPVARPDNETRTPSAHQAPLPTAHVPHSVSLRLDPEPLARFEALLSELRACGVNGGREEVVLDALETKLAECKAEAQRARRAREAGGKGAGGVSRDGTTRKAAPADSTTTPDMWNRASAYHASRSPYQVVIQMCPSCESGRVATSRGDLPLTHEALEAMLIDADYVDRDQRRRASIPPRVRRAVLARDGFRCRAPGCTGRQSLTLHHHDPVAAGGTNDVANLVTLCARCHRALHEKTAHGRRLREWRRAVVESQHPQADRVRCGQRTAGERRTDDETRSAAPPGG